MTNQIDDIQEDVRIIKDALLGNDFGNTGIVKRLENVEKKATVNKKAIVNQKSSSILYGTGAGGIIISIVEGIKAYFSH